MPRLCDTHAHLNSEAFDGDREEVIERSFGHADLAFVLDVGTDLPSSQRSIGLSRRYAAIRAAVGVHPHDASRYDGPALGQVLALAAQPEVVALGEMGLDFHYDHSPRDVQRRVFRRQLEHAGEAGLPLVLHVREAALETLEVLGEVFGGQPIRGVWHCFSEDWSVAEEVLALGLHVGLTGMVTFKRSDALREVARRVPLDRLLLETDSPYLSPVPVRKIRRNEPAHVLHVARAVARERELEVDALATSTTEAASALFGVEQP